MADAAESCAACARVEGRKEGWVDATRLHAIHTRSEPQDERGHPQAPAEQDGQDAPDHRRIHADELVSAPPQPLGVGRAAAVHGCNRRPEKLR